jgi:hypothetical protein
MASIHLPLYYRRRSWSLRLTLTFESTSFSTLAPHVHTTSPSPKQMETSVAAFSWAAAAPASCAVAAARATPAHKCAISQEQPTRIVVAPVAVSPVAGGHPAGYIVMTDPVSDQQQMYAPVAPATPTAVDTVEASALDANSSDHPTPATSDDRATTVHDGDLKTPLIKS